MLAQVFRIRSQEAESGGSLYVQGWLELYKQDTISTKEVSRLITSCYCDIIIYCIHRATETQDLWDQLYVLSYNFSCELP